MNPSEDPYAGLLLEMDGRARGVQPLVWCLGTVVTAEPGHLVIHANGMDLDEEDLYVNPSLLPGQRPDRVAVELSASPATLDVGGKNVRTHLDLGMSGVIEQIPLWELPGTLTGTLSGSVRRTETALAPGDQVVLLPDGEGQTYFVLCKAVRP